jgi:hypothetical protein
MRSFVVALTVAVVCGLAGDLRAFPEPAVVQGPDQWTLDITFEHPRQITVQPIGRERPERFWYMIVTLTNNSGRDVDLYPVFELMTDRFEVIQAGRSVHSEVFAAVKARHQARYPFLECFETTCNRLLQGADNTKDIAVIWPDFAAEVKSVKIFLAGLSNETAAVFHPVAKSEDGKPLRVVLAKTLELTYLVGGSAARRERVETTFQAKRWVMR